MAKKQSKPTPAKSIKLHSIKSLVNSTTSKSLPQKEVLAKATEIKPTTKLDRKLEQADTGMENLLKISTLDKFFTTGDQELHILKDINFKIDLGEFVVIFGPSGCGKSTLLHVLLGLEEPSSGAVQIFGEDLYHGTSQDDRSDVRKKHMGMVYQQPNWIKALSVVENVAFPLMLMGYDKQDALAKALRILIDLQMQQWADHIPTELSGGQQQRVSIARALINNPKIIIADEPTGNLDYQSGELVMSLLSRLNKEKKITVIMVTHDLEYLKYADRVIRMFDGEVVEEYSKAQTKKLLEKLQKDRHEFGLLNNSRGKNITK